MPVINVSLLSGRTPEKKRELVKELTDAYVRVLDAKPQSVHVILTDVEASDWAVAGTLISDR